MVADIWAEFYDKKDASGKAELFKPERTGSWKKAWCKSCITHEAEHIKDN